MAIPPGDVTDETAVEEQTVPPESSLVVSVVTSVADAADEPVEQLPPLDEAVDGDALEELFAGDGHPRRVGFRYHGFQVVVSDDRTVRVFGPGGEE